MNAKHWMFGIGTMALIASGCAGSDDAEPIAGIEVGAGDYVKGGAGKSDASVEAVFLDFEFDGQLLTTSSWNANSQIEDQLLYTVGQLNGDRSVGRLDKLVLSDVRTSSADGGKTRIEYHAKLLVAWGERDSVPATYELVLPSDISYQGQRDFTEKYKTSCVDWGAHDVDSGSMWYYYRPDAYRCDIADEDVERITASVSLSEVATTGRYPEYHKIYEDGVLRVVAVFGKYEDGAMTASDAGISAYNNFVRRLNTELGGLDVTTTPPSIDSAPGVEVPDITWEADLGDGRRIEVTALLVDNVRTAGADFNRRYQALSTRADLISYAGHAGLGANIRALASKGNWTQGQYTIVFLNGCDTYTYVDQALNEAHAAVNPDDPTGSKYVDIVTNAMPSYFSDMAEATMAMVRGLRAAEDPRTYEQIFRDIASAQVVLVSGEHDNVYVPGYDGGDTDGGDYDWSGLAESGSVAQAENDFVETPVLPAGRYRFELSGTGDADLYVRVGDAVSESSWDCRPYRAGSSEVCEVDLNTPAAIYVMVNGWAQYSSYELVASVLSQEPGGDTDTNQPTSYTNDDSVAVPDNAPGGVTSVIDIADSRAIESITLDLDITHTYRGDLRVTLSHAGTTVTIHNGDGGSADDVVLDDFDLSAFQGRELAGTWELHIVDKYARDTGTLNAWTLNVQ